MKNYQYRISVWMFLLVTVNGNMRDKKVTLRVVDGVTDDLNTLPEKAGKLIEEVTVVTFGRQASVSLNVRDHLRWEIKIIET